MCISHYSFDPKAALRETESRIATYQPGPNFVPVILRWIRGLQARLASLKPSRKSAELAE